MLLDSRGNVGTLEVEMNQGLQALSELGLYPVECLRGQLRTASGKELCGCGFCLGCAGEEDAVVRDDLYRTCLSLRVQGPK